MLEYSEKKSQFGWWWWYADGADVKNLFSTHFLRMFIPLLVWYKVYTRINIKLKCFLLNKRLFVCSKVILN